MCFNKSSSSAATSSNTTNRDERIGAEGGAIVGSAKDGAELTQTVAHTEEAENVFSLAPNAVLNFESTTRKLSRLLMPSLVALLMMLSILRAVPWTSFLTSRRGRLARPIISFRKHSRHIRKRRRKRLRKTQRKSLAT